MFQVIEVDGQKYQEVPAVGSRPGACKGCCFYDEDNDYCDAPPECPCGAPDHENGKWLKY